MVVSETLPQAATCIRLALAGSMWKMYLAVDSSTQILYTWDQRRSEFFVARAFTSQVYSRNTALWFKMATWFTSLPTLTDKQ